MERLLKVLFKSYLDWLGNPSEIYKLNEGKNQALLLSTDLFRNSLLFYLNPYNLSKGLTRKENYWKLGFDRRFKLTRKRQALWLRNSRRSQKKNCCRKPKKDDSSNCRTKTWPQLGRWNQASTQTETAEKAVNIEDREPRGRCRRMLLKQGVGNGEWGMGNGK